MAALQLRRAELADDRVEAPPQLRHPASRLVYQGAGGGVLRLAYREFVDDMARPAFTQDLTYDLPTDGSATTIAFQGLDIEVLEANNMGLRYFVQSGRSGRSELGEGQARTSGR